MTNAEFSRAGPCWRAAAVMSLLVLALLLPGCATTFRGSPEPVAENRDADLVSLRKVFDPAAVDACLGVQSDECRTKIVRARKTAEDLRFYRFEERVFYEGRVVGFAAIVSTLGLTTASAATSGTAAKVLAGLAAMITGARVAYDKEVLAEKTVQALFTTMRAQRTTLELRIRVGLQKPFGQYLLEEALGDLEAYRRAGTMHAALDTVTEVAGIQARDADLRLEETFGYRVDATIQRLQLAVCGTSVSKCTSINSIEDARMRRDCWPKAGVPAGTSLVDFMQQDAFTSHRALVATCMFTK